MRKPKVEKLRALTEYNYRLKRSQESIGIDISVGKDEIARLTALLPDRDHDTDVSLRKQLVEAKEKDRELREQYSQVSENVRAGIELQNTCEAWLEKQKIPIPDYKKSGISFSAYRS